MPAFDEGRLLGNSTSIDSDRRHLPSLDGLRGVAIGLVMLLHFVQWSAPEGGLLARVTAPMWSGVDLFFVLSGFLITGILIDAKLGSDPCYLRNFYARRALRIFPLYYGFLSVALLCAIVMKLRTILSLQGWLWLYGTNVKIAAANALVFDQGILNLNHFWSLAVEEHFYLVWPLLILITSRRGAMLLCVVVSIVALAMRLWLAGAGMSAAASVFTPCRMDALAIGGFLALALRGGDPRSWAKRLLVVFFALVSLSVVSRPVLPREQYRALAYTTIAVCWSLLLLGSLSGPLAALLSVRWLRSWGKYSYGMYVYHELVIRLMPDPTISNRGAILFALCGIALSFAVAYVSYHGYEKHFLKLKSRFVPRSEVSAAPMPAV